MRRHAAILGCAIAGLLVAGMRAGADEAELRRDTGGPFNVRVFGSRGQVTRVSGTACGLTLDYDVHGRGAGAALSGFLDGDVPTHVEVEEEGGARVLAGALGTSAGDAVVDLRVTDRAIVGRVGWRRFDLVARGDAYVGSMSVAGAITATSAVVNGRAALLALPPADLAAILPSLLTCYVQHLAGHGVTPLEVRVGGPPGYLPSRSSSVYTHF